MEAKDGLEDYEDWKALRDAKLKESDAPSISFEDVKKEFDMD